MRIVIGNDHRGCSAKQRLMGFLQSLGHEVIDLGACDDTISVDYPDFAVPVAESVSRQEVDRGILLCGTGIGMCIVANKVEGVRAVTCHDLMTAELSRRHNDANVLCMSADLLSEDLMDRMVRLWLEVGFDGGRHARRLEKIQKFESGE